MSTLVEATNMYFASQQLNNIWIINLYILIECLIFINILAHWRESNSAKYIALIVSIAFTSFWCVNILMMGGLFTIHNYIFTVAALLLITFSGLTLYHISGKETPTLFRNPRFWFCAGILILFSVDTVIFSLLDIITQRGGALVQSTWVIHSVFNIFANTLYAIGFFLCSSPPAK